MFGKNVQHTDSKSDRLTHQSDMQFNGFDMRYFGKKSLFPAFVVVLLFLITSAPANIARASTNIIGNIAYGPDPKQKFDVYLPNRPHNAPIIMMIHGGGWKGGDKTNKHVIQNKISRWVSKGFVFVSLNYRLLPRANPLEQIRDIARALAKVQLMARNWNAAPHQIIVMGHSSGAHLAALLAASPALVLAHGAKPWLATIVIDTAAFDIPDIMNGPHHRLYDNAFGNNRQFWKLVSPIHNMKTPPAPLLIICSTLRRKVCPRSKAFVKKSKELGGRVNLLRISKSHRELNSDLGLPGSYTQQVERFMTSLSLNIATLLARQ